MNYMAHQRTTATGGTELAGESGVSGTTFPGFCLGDFVGGIMS